MITKCLNESIADKLETLITKYKEWTLKKDKKSMKSWEKQQCNKKNQTEAVFYIFVIAREKKNSKRV